jgi:hypothetical protein
MKDLYGNEFESTDEYALRLYYHAKKFPTYRIHTWTSDEQKVGYTILLNNAEVEKRILDTPGIFIMYLGDPNRGGKCMYVSYTTWRLRDRVYRFYKEYYDKSTQYEDHVAGYKFRNRNYNKDALYYRFIPECQFPQAKRQYKLDRVNGFLAYIEGAELNTNARPC